MKNRGPILGRFLFPLYAPGEIPGNGGFPGNQLARAPIPGSGGVNKFIYSGIRGLAGCVRAGHPTRSLLRCVLGWGQSSRRCVLGPPCLCKEEDANAGKPCPPHRLWPLLGNRCAPGEPIVPKYTRRNINRVLNCSLAKLGFSEARKFTSNAIRGTQELRTTGNSLEVTESPWGPVGLMF